MTQDAYVIIPVPVIGDHGEALIEIEGRYYAAPAGWGGGPLEIIGGQPFLPGSAMQAVQEGLDLVEAPSFASSPP